MDAVGSTRLAPQPAWDRDRDFLPASPGAQPGDEGPGFRAFLSAINPLPHIPVIGAVYRYVTGEKSHPAAQVVGGFVFGGPIGMAIAALGAAFEHATGKTPLEMAIDTIRGAGPAEVATAGESGAGDADPPGAGAEAGASAGGQPGPAPAAAPIALAQAPAAGTASATPRGGDDPVDALHRPRVAGARDLAFYQAHAGARLPFAAPASSPAARLASLSPAAIPGPGAADAGALPAIPPPPPPLAPPILQPPTRQATVQAAQRPASRVEVAQATSPAQGQDFASRMLHGLDRYRSMRVGGDGRAAILDRTE
ncbi:MAG: hypothetical protein RLZZ276_3725 [Pseudomonadota bacterium]